MAMVIPNRVSAMVDVIYNPSIHKTSGLLVLSKRRTLPRLVFI